jgi:uncharacterized protein
VKISTQYGEKLASMPELNQAIIKLINLNRFMEDQSPSNPPPVNQVPPPNPPVAEPDFWKKMGVLFSGHPTVGSMGAGQMTLQDEKLWGMMCHFGGLLGLYMGMGFVPPLVIYLLMKDKSPFVASHAKEALNFQLTFLVFGAICLFFFWLLFPILLLMAASLLILVAGIVGGIKANQGEFMALPLTFRLIK